MKTEISPNHNPDWLRNAISDINHVKGKHTCPTSGGLFILRTERVMTEQFEDDNRSETARLRSGWISTYLSAIVRSYMQDYKRATQAHAFTNNVSFNVVDYTIEALSKLPNSFTHNLSILSADTSIDLPSDNWLFDFAMFVDQHKGQTGITPKDLGFELWPNNINSKLKTEIQLNLTLAKNKVLDLLHPPTNTVTNNHDIPTHISS